MAEKLFPEVPSDIDFPRDEEEILAFWKERGIFDKTMRAREGSPKGTFVFYEGPPTANGMPHNGHVLTRVMKDLFPRYRTMRGYHVPRKAGWDTHGLPVEVEVEKELRIHGKAAIEEYGIEPFTEKCIESVFRYTTEWERNTERIAFWVDQVNAYVTYHREYIESVWWALADLFKKDLLYRGHKVVWWWAQGGTALSSAEVGQGYKAVDDPSVYVAFPLTAEPERSLIVWTTTPWTLSSNMYAAVNASYDYVEADLGARKVVMAKALLEPLAKKLKVEATITKELKGADLVGLRYAPPFSLYQGDEENERRCWRVIAADFVTLDSGTGVVHIAPAFGEDDFQAHVKQTSPDVVAPLCAVKPDGTFVPEMGKYAGRWVKDCDDELAMELKERGLLLLKEQYHHDYPFCWRADEDPLIQYARPAWYIRTTRQKDDAIANNQAIAWQPEHIKDGRFGDFLKNNVDWALSRERYWGTPLPVWENVAFEEKDPRRYVVISSVDELRKQKDSNVAEVEAQVAGVIHDKERAKHLFVHKPWIDRVTFTVEGVSGEYKRVPEVIDCWFDTGCMPFAQWGFPHTEGSLEKLQAAFPADFISEAIDQTRGWFYTLLMVSTLVMDDANRAKFGLKSGGSAYPHPFKNCIVLGHVSDKDGKKESKSKGNYTPPEVILDRVRMEFAVIDDEAATRAGVRGHKAKEGVAFIGKEDLDGLDLQDGAIVLLYGEQQLTTADFHPKKKRVESLLAAGGKAFELRALKGLKRRVLLLAEADRIALGAVVGEKGADVMPVEVPRLPSIERVYVEDSTTPAPGADAFRWFFYAASPPWTNTRHSLSNVRELQRDFLLKLRNVFSFFSIYANIDGYSPKMSAPAVKERPLLDRYILSELSLLTRAIAKDLDGYLVYDAAQKVTGFVEALSNWYVRRSRDRFWASGVGEEMGDDKRAAYATLHRCLADLSKITAPFVPFFAERLYQALIVGKLDGAKESVHLEDFPEADAALIDEALSIEMAAVRELVSLGLSVRTQEKLKVRQPLARVDLVVSRAELASRIPAYAAMIQEELNVHEVRVLASGQEGSEVRYELKPNFRSLGPKVGKKVQLVKHLLANGDAGAMRATLLSEGKVTLDLEGELLELTGEDLEIAVRAADGFAAAGGRAGVVVLHTVLTPELLDEGLAREIQSRLQGLRKEAGLGFTDRVRASVEGGERIARVVHASMRALCEGVLIDELTVGTASFETIARSVATIDGEEVTLSIARA